MILLLGASGYVGQAFQELFDRKGIAYIPVSRSLIDYYDRDRLVSLIESTRADFLINAAGFTGKPNVDACEVHKAETLLGNAVLPGIIREACERVQLPWGHVSSGCIYTGRRADGAGFTEEDAPNFSFRTNNCSFYSGTKALGEEALQGAPDCYVWRLRIPFEHIDSPRNYLSKLLNYKTLLEAENSISHLGEFVSACWTTWEKKVPYGIYNVVNPGPVMTSEVTKLLKEHLAPNREFEFFKDEDDFMQIAAKTPRSNCVMDTSKLESVGIKMRSAKEAIIDSLQNWEKA